MGASDARTCFVKGTLVKTANGFKKIEEIRVGDAVASFNEHTGRLEYHRVTETFIHPTKLIYKLTYTDGTTVETTWNHPFYIEGRGWIEAKELRAGMESVIGGDAENGFMALNEPAQPQSMIRMASSGTRPSLKGLAIVSIERITRDDTVYNIEVDGNHTYFVTEREVGVHNYGPAIVIGGVVLTVSDALLLSGAIAAGICGQTKCLEQGVEGLRELMRNYQNQGFNLSWPGAQNMHAEGLPNPLDIAREFGLTPKQVKDKIHELKNKNLPRGGPERNPDVVVGKDGEVHLRLKDGTVGDSIGNILD